jgi:hypothetical protein
VPELVYPSRTRGALSVLTTSNGRAANDPGDVVPLGSLAALWL